MQTSTKQDCITGETTKLHPVRKEKKTNYSTLRRLHQQEAKYYPRAARVHPVFHTESVGQQAMVYQVSYQVPTTFQSGKSSQYPFKQSQITTRALVRRVTDLSGYSAHSVDIVRQAHQLHLA